MDTEIQIPKHGGSDSSEQAAVETTRLAELEHVIETGLTTCFDVGHALAQIKEQSLYRLKGFGSFVEYCEAVWKFKKSYAYQLVQSAAVMRQLPAPVSTIVKCLNHGQVRELAKVPSEQREAVIRAAVTNAKDDGRKMTARDISESAKLQLSTVIATSTAIGIFRPRPMTGRGIWKWYHNATKRRRGKLLECILGGPVKVEVEDKAAFRRSVDRWFEQAVSESGGRHE